MRAKYRLALRRDVLAPLGDDELSDVVGADAPPTLPPNVCIPEVTSRAIECHSLLTPCVTSTCER